MHSTSMHVRSYHTVHTRTASSMAHGMFERKCNPLYVETLYVCIAMPLDHNFMFSMVVARSQTKRAISKAKRVIGLKLAGGLALGVSSRVELIKDASNSVFTKKIPYGGFPQIRSHSSYTSVSLLTFILTHILKFTVINY